MVRGKCKSSEHMKSTLLPRGLVLATIMAINSGLTTVSAQQDEAEEKKGWETSAALGVILTRGNSETFLGTVTLDTKRKWEHDELGFGVIGGYGEAEDPDTGDNVKNTEFIRGFGQYNHLFTERLYGGIRADGEYDGIAGVDYRLRISPLLGYYLIKNDRTSLSAEAGPSVVFENLEDGHSDTYIAARFGERFEHKLTDTTKVWQSVEYLPDVSDWSEKYLINAEIGIDSAITKKLSLRVVVQDTYDSQPSSGRKENDIRIITGLAYKL